MHTGVNPNRQKVREAYAKKAGKGDRDAAGLENRAAQQSAIRQEHKVQAKQHLDRMNNVRRPTAWEVHDDSFMGPKAEFSAQKNRAHCELPPCWSLLLTDSKMLTVVVCRRLEKWQGEGGS